MISTRKPRRRPSQLLTPQQNDLCNTIGPEPNSVTSGTATLSVKHAGGHNRLVTIDVASADCCARWPKYKIPDHCWVEWSWTVEVNCCGRRRWQEHTNVTAAAID